MTKLPGPHRNLKIGLFGGSFNPAHSGHFHVAAQAMKALELDRVWWLVANGNPLKNEKGEFDERLQSAYKLANDKRMIVSDLERMESLTYSIDTLKFVQKRATSCKFVWLMGSDILDNFHRWRDWNKFAHSVPICIVSRPTKPFSASNSRFAQRFAKYRVRGSELRLLLRYKSPTWGVLSTSLNYESSTKIRGQHVNTKILLRK